MRVVIASYGAAQFRFLGDTLARMGHVPIAYIASRSMRPSTLSEPDLLAAIRAIVTDLPRGMDLLLPGGTRTIGSLLASYRPDVVLVFGFNWRLPRDVLEVPRLGVLNVHPSVLPKYRGPSPVPWAIRNGDAFMGITVHRMTEHIDAGPILAQADDLPIPDEVASEHVWDLTTGALPNLLGEALERVSRGDPGMPQDESMATYAGFPTSDWYRVTWSGGRRDLHNQIRALRFLTSGRGPVVEFQDRTVQVLGTSLNENGSVRIECEDGPLWVTVTHRDLPRDVPRAPRANA